MMLVCVFYSPCKRFRFIWIFIYFTFCKIKNVLITQCKSNTELLILKLIFIYFVYIGLSNVGPRMDEIIRLDIPYIEQFQFMLLNIGILKNSITDLKQLSNDNVIFALNLVNSEHSLPQILSSMEVLGCSFKSAHIIIFVSAHSIDHTKDIIKHWQSEPPNCTNIHSKVVPFTFGSSSNDRVFHTNGSVDIVAITPRKELEEIERMIETKRGGNTQIDIGEFRNIFHQNLLLDKALEIYDDEGEGGGGGGGGNDYLIFVEAAALVDFDIQSIGTEFERAWRSGYDVVCANGIKYNGWYFDSFPTILTDHTWFIGIDKYTCTNTIRSEQFVDVNSCNNGFIAYDLKLIKETKCRYFTTAEAHEWIHTLSNFTKRYSPESISLHVPFNYCLKERGNAKIAIASRAYTYLGVIKDPSISINDRL